MWPGWGPWSDLHKTFVLLSLPAFLLWCLQRRLASDRFSGIALERETHQTQKQGWVTWTMDTPNSKTGVGEIPKDSNCNWKVTTGGGLSQEVGKSDLVPEKKGGSVGGGAPRCWVTKGSRLPLAPRVRLATHDMRHGDRD